MSHDVIVPVHNGGRDVENCLNSIFRHLEPDVVQNLIIVDDCSGSEMKAYLERVAAERDCVQLIRLDSQHYYTKASNIGLRRSSAQYRTLLNSDTVVTKDWIHKIRDAFSISPEIGIVGPLSNAASTQSVPFIKSSANQTAINTLPSDVSIDEFARFIEVAATGVLPPFTPLVHGFCLTLSSRVIDEIGLFDEELFPRGYGEENDYCFRAENAGFILCIALDAFVYHVKSKSYASAEREAFMRAGMTNLAERHGVTRIRAAVDYMESHPSLHKMRQAVLNRWPEFYGRSL